MRCQESHVHPQYEKRVCSARRRCAVPDESYTLAVREKDVQLEEQVCSGRRRCAVPGASSTSALQKECVVGEEGV